MGHNENIFKKRAEAHPATLILYERARTHTKTRVL